jgi:hypothetical protein
MHEDRFGRTHNFTKLYICFSWDLSDHSSSLYYPGCCTLCLRNPIWFRTMLPPILVWHGSNLIILTQFPLVPNRLFSAESMQLLKFLTKFFIKIAPRCASRYVNVQPCKEFGLTYVTILLPQGLCTLTTTISTSPSIDAMEDVFVHKPKLRVRSRSMAECLMDFLTVNI